MNMARLKNIERNLSSTTKKILHIMPVGEEITFQRMLQLLADSNLRMQFTSIQRCVHELVECKLIKQVKENVYLRVFVADYRETKKEPAGDETIVATITQQPKIESSVPLVAVAAPTTPMDRLASLAQSLRNLADEIDNAIIDAEEQLQAVKAESAKMTQLKEILKTL